MKIVIELDDKLYNRIKYLEPKADTMLDELMRSIQSGTPLPKGHGRLIDEQHIIDRFKPVEKFEYWRIGLDGLINVLSDEPTIIEGSNKE